MATARSRRPRQHNQQQQEPREKVLRIGVILGGKIVEEKLLSERTTVTVGQSAQNTFSAPIDGLPRSWPLFVLKNDEYMLSFSESMDGRMSGGAGDGDVSTLDALKGREAKRVGDAWQVPLPETARGKIVIGDMTLLFQFVDKPPVQPRAHLPASVRGTFADRIDPNLAIILAVSLLLHFSVVIYAYQHDRVIKTRSTQIFNDTFQQPKSVAPIEKKIEQPKVEDKSAEEKKDKEEDKPKKKAKKSGEPKKASKGGKGKPKQRTAEEIREIEEEAAAAVAAFTSGMSDSGVGLPGDADGRNPATPLDKQISQARGKKVTVGGGTGDRGVREDGDGGLGTGEGPDVEGPGTSTTKTKTKTKEKVPRGRVKVGGGSSDDDTTLDPSAVMRKIKNAYMPGLKRCHKDLLKRDPTAGGRVALKFMVGPSGRITRVKANGFDSGVDRCIEKRAKTWRFGVPKDEDGDATDATFRISLVLQAN